MSHLCLFYNKASFYKDTFTIEGGLKLQTTIWFKLELHKYFNNTIYKHCFQPPWIAPRLHEKFIVFRPKYGACLPEYVNAINTWIYLTKRLQGSDKILIKRCLFHFIDIHMHNIYKLNLSPRIDVQENLNNDMNTLRPLVTQIITQILPPTRNKNLGQIIHLLQKSMPQRCQIRNLQTIVISYIQESDKTFQFLLLIIKHSLLGLYPHCKVLLNYEGREIIFDTFVNQLSHKTFFIKWLRNGPTETQIFLFYCLKEFLVYAVRMSATVYNVVDEKYNWGKFDKQVSEFMDSIRQTLSNVAVREYTFVNRSNWMIYLDPLLQNVSKNHTKLFRTTPQLSYYGKTSTFIQKFFISKNKFTTTSLITDNMPKIMWKILQRLAKKEDLWYFLTFFNVRKDIIHKLINQTFSDKDFNQCNIYTLECIYECCKLLDRRISSGLFILPQHLYDMQINVLKKRSDDNTIDKTTGLNFICTSCNDIKIFLMKKSTSSRHSNKLAKGSLRVVVSNEVDNLRWVCGKRAERHTKNTKRKFKTQEKTEKEIIQNNRKIAKEKIRDITSKRCISTDLLEVDLLGQSLLFNGKLMILCSSCASATVVDNKSFNYDQYLNCQTCTSEKKQICTKCKSNEHICSELLVYDSTICKFCIAYFCPSCATHCSNKQPIKI